MQSVIDELHEKRANEVPLEPNPGSLIDVDVELATDCNKPTDADITLKQGELNVSIEHDETDDDFSDEPPIFSIASDIERVVEILSQLTLYRDRRGNESVFTG